MGALLEVPRLGGNAIFEERDGATPAQTQAHIEALRQMKEIGAALFRQTSPKTRLSEVFGYVLLKVR